MSFFRTPTPAPTPRTKDAGRVALFYAIILIIFILAQLFTYDKFLPLLVTFDLPGGLQTAYILGALLVTAEVFALPFLLRMPLSRLFRWLSLLCGWDVAIIWIFLTSWLVITDTPVESVGFLGTLVGLLPGWWAIFVSISLLILAAWASWGMWPGRAATKR